MRPPAPPRQPRREPPRPAPAREPAGRPGRSRGAGEPAGPSTAVAVPAPARGRDVTPTAVPAPAPSAALPRVIIPRGSGPQTPVVSTGLAARMAERARASRHLLRRRVLVAAGVLVALLALGWLLLVSPVLALDGERIDVVGASGTVDPAAVTDLVEPELGTPLLRVDTGEVADRVASLTTVKEALVARSWPDGLVVTVVPRVPVAAASTPEGWVLVDADGVQVGSADQVPPGIPRVTVPLGQSDETAPAVEAVLAVLGTLPPDLLTQVAEAGAASREQVTLTLVDGAQVRWGSADESELKAAVLAVLRQQPAGVYDVSVPRAPTTS